MSGARWFFLGVAMLSGLATAETETRWAGVDETVVERVAEAAGRPARAPFVNTDQGDLLLFVFLIAGAAGGFVAGYSYRMLAEGRRSGKAS